VDTARPESRRCSLRAVAVPAIARPGPTPTVMAQCVANSCAAVTPYGGEVGFAKTTRHTLLILDDFGLREHTAAQADDLTN